MKTSSKPETLVHYENAAGTCVVVRSTYKGRSLGVGDTLVEASFDASRNKVTRQTGEEMLTNLIAWGGAHLLGDGITSLEAFHQAYRVVSK